jgi:hypothetical protein
MRAFDGIIKPLLWDTKAFDAGVMPLRAGVPAIIKKQDCFFSLEKIFSPGIVI